MKETGRFPDTGPAGPRPAGNFGGGTTGGFLLAGNTTFLCGTDDEKVDEAIEIVGKHSKKRTQLVPSSASYGVGMYSAFPVEVQVGGATIFVTNVERFEKL